LANEHSEGRTVTIESSQIPSAADTLKVSSPHMTIADAQRVYRDYGDDLEEFYVSLYSTLIADRGSVELQNSNYLHALQLTSLMLRNTTKKFRMLGGSTTDSFISVLKDEFRHMLTRLKELGGTARIIALNSESDRDVVTSLAKEFPAEEKIGHFIVADSMVRIEEPHVKLTSNILANSVKAKVIFNNQSQAAQYADQFDSLWRMLTPALKTQ
jgi:hypothetical protein